MCTISFYTLKAQPISTELSLQTSAFPEMERFPNQMTKGYSKALHTSLQRRYIIPTWCINRCACFFQTLSTMTRLMAVRHIPMLYLKLYSLQLNAPSHCSVHELLRQMHKGLEFHQHLARMNYRLVGTGKTGVERIMDLHIRTTV